ncbi:heme/hemin ABC transporter substrate-binding protein [Corynebacterium amycolatum]|uniref:heme/hemin ABC transporter substrate-binding protein n=1 Tax=Corynebacterium amycolatum TaxID=43765 RepID=UPI00211A5442|nr:ABC transporter substrate-binding protein [Corynebacterium amycolatum]MCQ9166867.1 ABC transporter substrate-binding protein [Corynebacterium amycolatum]MCQ9173868.1 ABC transporter substrate-binding protein [Corynebacterium amycolatum]
MFTVPACRVRSLAGTLLSVVLVAGLVACGSDDAAREGASSSSAGVTTVPRADNISAHGAAHANLPSENPEVLLKDPKPAEDKDYQRILTLDRAGALSRAVYTLGLGDRLVGRDSTSDFPAVKDLPNLTIGGHAVNAESVMKLKPELIITDGSIGPSRVFDTFEKAGITVVHVSDERTPETINTLIDEVAGAVGLADQVGPVKEHLDTELAAATEYAQAKADGRKMMILYVRGTGVAMIAGPDSGGRSLITRLGGVDAGEGVGIEGAFTPITPESLIAAAPDTILVMSGGLESVGGIEGLKEIPGIAQTPAGQNESVVDVPDSQLLSFDSQSPRAIRAIADALYGGGAGDGAGDGAGAGSRVSADKTAGK